MPTGGGTDRPTNHLTDRPMTDRSVFVVVVVVAWGITRVFVAHNSASMRGYATHHIGLCHWVFWCQIPGSSGDVIVLSSVVKAYPPFLPSPPQVAGLTKTTGFDVI